MMSNTKNVIQSLIPDVHDSVHNVIIGANSKYTYTLASQKDIAIDVDTIIKDNSNIDEIEDRLAQAAICDFPHNTVGYIRSSRFQNIPPLFLLENNVKILYGRVIYWNAWFLSLFFKADKNTFTKIRGFLPFENLNLEDFNQNDSTVTSKQIMDLMNILLNERSSNDGKENSSIPNTNKLYNMANKQLFQAIDGLNLSSDILEDLNVSILYKILHENDSTLENSLSPVDNLFMCFYLCQKICDISTKLGFSQTIYAMYGMLSMLNDFNLKQDFVKAIEIPIEYIRRITIEIDCVNLRNSKKINILKKGSYLRKQDLYNLHMTIKNENWSDVAYYLAVDKFELTDERLCNIYMLFLTNNKSTRFYYITFLCSMFERCRMILNKAINIKSTQRIEEVNLFDDLFQKFHYFIKQIALKSEENTKLSLKEITDFLSCHENDVYNMLNIITRDDLIASCMKYIDMSGLK